MRNFLFVPLFLSLVFACRKGPENPELYQPQLNPQAETESGQWYVLREGQFKRIEDIRPGLTKFLPWTVQARIADMVSLKEKLFLAVNGHGIASLNISASNSTEFEYFYDTLIFQYRTITTLIPGNKTLLCHLYFNKLLNITTEEQLKIQGISLLKLFPKDGIYQFISPPFQTKHPDWESVGFIPEKSDRFFLEWKYSDKEETLFQYSLFSLIDLSEEYVDRLKFRQAFHFQEIDNETPPGLKILFQAAVKRLQSRDITTAFHFLVRSKNEPLISRYRYYPEGFAAATDIQLHSVPVFEEREIYYLLTPQGLILRAYEEGDRIKIHELPLLPDNFIYKDLFVSEQDLIVTWEESLFTQVGAAGIFIRKIPFFH